MRRAVKLLLIPSWIVGVAGVMMGTPAIDRLLNAPYSQIVGHTVLFGVFLAPLLNGLAFACNVGAWVVLARGFTS